MPMEEDGASEEGSDTESDKENKQGPCNMVEFKALQKELEERNSQRDEFLLKLNVRVCVI